MACISADEIQAIQARDCYELYPELVFIFLRDTYKKKD